MSQSDSINVAVSCHCRLFAQNITIPAFSLPLKSALCSCNSCRHISGHLFATFAVMPVPFPTDQNFFYGLSKYQSTVNLERWFCSRCGASICNYDRSDEEWEFCSGVIDALGKTEPGKGCLDGKLNRAYLWVSDTADGGGLSWLNEGKENGLAGRYWRGRDSGMVTDGELAELEHKAKELAAFGRHEKLTGSCHCGAVTFDIAPPAVNGKYGGWLCACTSCRKTTGFEIASWTHVPLTSSTLELQSQKVGHYSSSSGRERYFCKTCGATIMFAAEDLDTVAVATGLFDPQLGARAEPLLKWNPRGDGVGFAEDATDHDFVRKLVSGISAKT